MKIRHLGLFVAIGLGPLVGAMPAMAAYEPPIEERVDALEQEVSELDNLADNSVSGATLFLFGAFCALWAQRTGRNPWLWFFLGLFFSVITVLVLLYKNSKGQSPAVQPEPRTRDED